MLTFFKLICHKTLLGDANRLYILQEGGEKMQAALPANQFKTKTMTCPSFTLQIGSENFVFARDSVESYKI